jgi:hypothetical protein
VRASHPSLRATGRTLVELRETLIEQWADQLSDRPADSSAVPRPLLERQLRLIVDAMAEMIGPFRREAKDLWARACEHFGRVGAARGLAAGEVVEELQVLRELLIRNLAPVLSALRARQAMAIMLRLNAVLDKGIAVAVAGYTDALVAELFARDGVPAQDTALDAAEVERQLEAIERTLGELTALHAED